MISRSSSAAPAIPAVPIATAACDSAGADLEVEVIHRPDADACRHVQPLQEPAAADHNPRIAGGEHDPRWLHILHRALGHEPYLLLAWDAKANGWLRGCLTLALVRSRLFGRFLVSLPYLNRGGVVAEDDAAATALIDRAVKLADELNVQYLELRHQHQPIAHPALTHTRDDKQRMVLDLPASEAELWQSLTAKVRNQIRKGDRHDLSIRFGSAELLDAFYRVFAVNMRDLGTPVYPRRLFAEILRSFEHTAELAVVFHAKQPVAAALLLHHPAAAEPATSAVPSASCLREQNHTCANMWMYHQLLARAVRRGGRLFDFGRSSVDSGTYRFKKQWGARPLPAVWQYHVRQGDITVMRPDHPAHQRRIAVWRRLPVWVTTVVGPRIVSGIP
jgi:serine/alanine adding enzyme